MKEKVIEDGTKNKYMTFKAQFLCFLGIFFGMIITSFIKNGTVDNPPPTANNPILKNSHISCR